LGVLDAIASGSESWGIQLAENLRFGLLLFAEADVRLTQLDRLFHDRPFRLSLSSLAQSSTVKNFWLRFDALPLEKQQAFAAPVLNKVSLLTSTESLRRMFGHRHPVDLAAHINTPGSLTVISLAINQLHSAGWAAGGMLLSAICREVFSRVGIAESERNPLRIYADEFENLPFREFETILSEGRRFHFSAVISHQSLAQLTPRLRAVILGNVGTKIVFNVSHQDAVTLNKDLTGDAKTFDLARLPVGEAVLWRRGREPVQIEVNAPLISDVGRITPHAKVLLDKLESLKPRWVEIEAPGAVIGQDSSPSGKSTGSGPKKRKTLEDWL
jgi:hypothetical protein